MNMSPDEFDKVSKTINIVAAEMDEYFSKIASAHKFAEGDHSDETWNGLFLLGLSIAGLELVPVSTMIEIRYFWIKCSPKGLSQDWEPSWIVPIDTFNKAGKS